MTYSGPILDTHVHVLWGDDAQQAGVQSGGDHILPLASEAGIDRLALIVMAPENDLEKTRVQNDDVLALSASSDGRILPVCSVHPADGEPALSEIRRIAGLGAKMLKLHPNTQRFDVEDERVYRVVDQAAEAGLPILFDAYSPFDSNQPGKFIMLAASLPHAKLVLAHLNGPRFPEMLAFDLLKSYAWWRRNVWFDISATVTLLAGSPFMEQFRWVIRRLGVDRILFGSDYPLIVSHPKEAVNATRQLGLTEEEERQVFHDTGAELLDLA